MRIDFYEEFPSKENLDKLRLVKFKTRVFVAAKSLEEFYHIKRKIKNRKVELAYWPIMKGSYWISPFSDTKDLINLFKKLDESKIRLLIDLELPLKKGLIFKNLFKFTKNKRIINRFMEKNKERITTAQFPYSFLQGLVRFFGLEYDVNCEKSLMFYTSVIPSIMKKSIAHSIKKIKNKEDYAIGLGTIARGILGNERILSAKGLEKDLELVKKLGFQKVIIFRLGGLNKGYIETIEEFV